MTIAALLQDTAIAVGAGYAGTKAMEQFSMKAYQLEAAKDREREEAVRPGPPFVLAADHLLSRILGIELADEQAKKVGMALHYGAGLSWTPVYAVLRRMAGWSPLAAGLATGASMSLILDEGITPAIGASAPNPAYPRSTHVRAFIAHLVYGLAVAGFIEAAWRLLGRRP